MSSDEVLIAEFEQRMSLATPAEMVRGLIFNGALAVVRTQGGDALVKRCIEVTGEKRFVDFFNYPVASFLKVSLLASQELGPRCGGIGAFQRQMGAHSVREFFSSMAGRTLLLLAGEESERLLANVPSGFRTAVTYGERSVETLGPKSMRITMTRDFTLSAYGEGVLLGALEVTHAKNPRVTSRLAGPLDTVYEATWE